MPLCLHLHRLEFLPTPSARRATDFLRLFPVDRYISTHALREEGDMVSPPIFLSRIPISTHALREEGDGDAVRGCTMTYSISTHALREEGDRHPV